MIRDNGRYHIVRIGRTALMTCLMITAALGCAQSSPHEANAPPPATQPVAAVRDVDQRVIEAALADLLTLSDSPAAMRKAPPAELRFAAEASPYPVKTEQILMQREKEQWAALSREQM